MDNELILWAALGALIALLALAVWAGRRGLHALGVVGPGQRPTAQARQMDELIIELRRLNANLEAVVEANSQRSSKADNE
ncbi:MAG: hypothetical protein AAGF48_15730 [Pseudomonadota bacterium]